MCDDYINDTTTQHNNRHRRMSVDGTLLIELNQKYMTGDNYDDNDQQTLSMSSPPRPDHKSPPKRNRNVVDVWGKGKSLYTPMIGTDIERFDINQDRTKKDYQDDALKIRTRSTPSIIKFFHIAKHNVQYSVAQGASSFDRTLEAVDSKTRFNLVFPEISIDQYQGAYRCRLIIPDDVHNYSGQCFVCTDYVCFYVESIDDLFEPTVPLKISCPLIHVQKITKASKIIRRGEVEVFPLAGDQKPSVIQLWTTDEKVHQFTAFGANFDSVFLKIMSLYRLHLV
eukprot:TRINITY_DN235_c0_g5_i1.p1 TRINITY_DN235_c0_g5~~TRINITY_DN235_c0_g5_i1.p1  ORF type:complete len:282 (+),score=28.06 TRINITY_DN235_c0_g5_i1:178-1023(+)